MDTSAYFVAGLFVLCLGFAIWEGGRGPTAGGSLQPLGIICAIAGLAGAGWAAFYFDVTVSSYDGDDIVNFDAVGMRTIYFVAAAAVFIVGAVMAAAGYIVDSLRPRATPEEPSPAE
jgi:hypothetical protein